MNAKNRFILKPYLIYMISIPFVILIGVLYRDLVIDINIKDTMFMMSFDHFTFFIVALFAGISFCYWLLLRFNVKLSYWLNLIHVLLTIGGLMAMFYALSFTGHDFQDLLSKNKIFLLSIVIMIFGQLILLINGCIGMWKKYVRTAD